MQREMNRLFEQFFDGLPGLEAKDVEVVIAEDILTIKGEKRQDHEDKDETHYVMERTDGAFSRTVRLPVPVAADKVKATFKNGILTMSRPKTEAAKQKAIPINVG